MNTTSVTPTPDAADRLKSRLRRALHQGKARDGPATHHPPPPDDRPACGYGLVVRSALDEIRSDVAELKGRINGLLFAVLGAIVVDVVLRLIG